jgi:ABC-type transport system involved in multi-copper enzyme maturation permease subunit
MISKIIFFILSILGALFISYSISLFSGSKNQNSIFTGLSIGAILIIIALYIFKGI